MCSSTQYLVLGGMAAVVAAVVSGNDVVGWIVGGAVALVTFVAGRIWPRLRGSGACAVPRQDALVTEGASVRSSRDERRDAGRPQ